MLTQTPIFGGIEGGGTKFVCAVGTSPDDIRAETRFPTTTPHETLRQAIEFFQQFDGLSTLGVACFGPLDPRPESPTFGHILPTPKPGWSNADVVGPLKAALHLPVAFDTDVNGATLAEWRWGAAQNCNPVLYLTIGTGVGGGVLVNGQPLHGLLHPEMGHISLPHDLAQDPFPGTCPFHGDCFEGLACGLALEKRWGARAETFGPEHPAWELEAHYIALALRSYICTLSPQKIVLGGGVTSQEQMLPLIHRKTQELLNGYVQSPAILEQIDNYIVSPGLGSRAGVLGAIALAASADSKVS
jgi:fructokinase